MTGSTRYDRIGRTYTLARRTDPHIARRIHAALGGALRVVNVGCGTGSYEPADREVIGVDPSATMLAQRPSGSVPAVRAVAEALPFGDRAFDAAMCILTVHHWTDLARGLRELRRVADRQVVFFFEPEWAERFWLLSYFPEVLDLPS